jgi:hypothetical protein
MQSSQLIAMSERKIECGAKVVKSLFLQHVKRKKSEQVHEITFSGFRERIFFLYAKPLAANNRLPVFHAENTA